MKRLLVVLAVPAIAACEPQVATSCPPVPSQHVITIPEDWPYPFDAQPGDRLDLLMVADGGQQARCDHSGGRLVLDLDRDLWTCQGVDY